MLLELKHQTTFDYSAPVTDSYVEFRLTPVTDVTQRVLQHRFWSEPATTLRQYVDGLGATVTYFNIPGAHDRVVAHFESLVETLDVIYRGGLEYGVAPDSPAGQLALFDFLQPTTLTRYCDQLETFVSPLLPLARRTASEAAAVLRQELYDNFRYQPDITNASSSIADILSHRGGVCQDFAHLMIATCRRLGFPTRYVSGYVLPDDGTEAAASHAWCEVFDPAYGWLGVDPTHNCWAGERYIRVATGRDFRDVPPNRGVYRGAAAESLSVEVKLSPIGEDDLAKLTRTPQPGARPLAPGTRFSRPQPVVSIMQQSQEVQQQQQQQ